MRPNSEAVKTRRRHLGDGRADVAIQVHVAFLKGHHASPSNWACRCLAAVVWLSWRKAVDGTVGVEYREGTTRQVRAG